MITKLFRGSGNRLIFFFGIGAPLKLITTSSSESSTVISRSNSDYYHIRIESKMISNQFAYRKIKLNKILMKAKLISFINRYLYINFLREIIRSSYHWAANKQPTPTASTSASASASLSLRIRHRGTMIMMMMMMTEPRIISSVVRQAEPGKLSVYHPHRKLPTNMRITQTPLRR